MKNDEDEHPNAEDYRNRAEAAEQRLKEPIGYKGTDWSLGVSEQGMFGLLVMRHDTGDAFGIPANEPISFAAFVDAIIQLHTLQIDGDTNDKPN